MIVQVSPERNTADGVGLKQKEDTRRILYGGEMEKRKYNYFDSRW